MHSHTEINYPVKNGSNKEWGASCGRGRPFIRLGDSYDPHAAEAGRNSKDFMQCECLANGKCARRVPEAPNRNFVVDFFDFYIGKHHFATFNVADSAITIAAGLIIIDYLFISKGEKEKEGPTEKLES